MRKTRPDESIDRLRNRLERAENSFWRYATEAEHQNAICAASDALRTALERHAIA